MIFLLLPSQKLKRCDNILIFVALPQEVNHINKKRNGSLDKGYIKIWKNVHVKALEMADDTMTLKFRNGNMLSVSNDSIITIFLLL